eukprot:2603993-Rhodomonas_salina.2
MGAVDLFSPVRWHRRRRREQASQPAPAASRERTNKVAPRERQDDAGRDPTCVSKEEEETHRKRKKKRTEGEGRKPGALEAACSRRLEERWRSHSRSGPHTTGHRQDPHTHALAVLIERTEIL